LVLVLFLIAIAAIEWQFSKVYAQIKQLHLKMIRELDRDNLRTIFNDNSANNSNNVNLQ